MNKKTIDLLSDTSEKSLLEPVVTNRQIQCLDTAINSLFTMPLILLMENAGRVVAENVVEHLQRKKVITPKILIFAGPGNNGGDAIVCARYLLNQLIKAHIVLLILPKADYQGDASINYEILKKIVSTNSTIEIIEVTHKRKLNRIKNFQPDVIIDGIFGTGFRGSPEGIFQDAIELINHYNAYKIAIDIPSGVNGDTGWVQELAVKAQQTISMGLYKRGHWLYPGRTHCGLIKIAHLGIDYKKLFWAITNSSLASKKTKLDSLNNISSLKKLFASETYLLTLPFIKQIFPQRRPDGHKGTFGSVVVVAGGKGYSGAACLTALSALRTGAGLVRLCFPLSINSAVEKKLTEVIKVPIPTTSEGTFALSGYNQIKDVINQSDVLAIGPGVTTHPETKELIRKIILTTKIPMVLDADAINNITVSTLLKIPKNQRANMVLTPHPGELSRLIEITPETINRERIDLCEQWAKRLGVILVLKGAPTVIGTPEGIVFINPTGNSGLAKGGSGDVLTGLIAGFVAQGVTPAYAACVGVYLHGLCADLKVKSTTEYCLTASDLINQLPKAINQLLQ
ncbi:MAG: NAD(P)H-hydrate dehydratase [candidate division WOR-3 bacterium]